MKKLNLFGSVSSFMLSNVEYFFNNIKDTDEIAIYVNSGGGSVFTGWSIYQAIARHEGPKKIYIDGLAASMMSIIPLAFKKEDVILGVGANVMIHDPLTITWGDEKDHEKSIEILQSIKKNMIDLYEARLNMTKDEASDLMKKETWYSSKEAEKIGFGVRGKIPGTENTQANFDYENIAAELHNYNNVPDDIKSQYGLNEENENENTLEDSMPMSAEQQKEMDDLKAQALEDSKKIGGLETENSTLKAQAEAATGLQAANDALTTTNTELSASNEAFKVEASALKTEKLLNESEKSFKNDYPFLVDEDGSQLKALMAVKASGDTATVAVIENSYKQLNAARDPKVNKMLNEIGADGEPKSEKVAELSQKDYEAKISETMVAHKVDRMTAMEILDKPVEG